MKAQAQVQAVVLQLADVIAVEQADEQAVVELAAPSVECHTCYYP